MSTLYMKQYINKSAVVAMIKKLNGKVDDGSSYCNGWQQALRMLEMELATLETEEVDFEKEIYNYLDNHNLNIQDGGRIVFNNGDTPNFWCDFRDIAEHFYELGLTQKGE